VGLGTDDIMNMEQHPGGSEIGSVCQQYLVSFFWAG
jgi:hypothetical protein